VTSKILGKSGDSLADIYDVSGSIAGVEELDSENVKVVHEMGSTIFSERYSQSVRRMQTGDILQTITWDIVITDLPSTPTRVLGVVVLVDVGSRVAHCQVSVRSDAQSREIPIWVYDAALDSVGLIRIDDNGTIANQGILVMGAVGGVPQVPNMLTGSEAPQVMNAIAFRGLTTTFGAGDVNVVALVSLGFSQVGGLSSRGLPIPGW